VRNALLTQSLDPHHRARVRYVWTSPGKAAAPHGEPCAAPPWEAAALYTPHTYIRRQIF
jgi:hypothetical protein